MEFPVAVDSLLLPRCLEQHLVCVAVSAVEGIDVNGGVGSFRLPKSNDGTSSVYYSTLRLWVIPVVAAKFFNQGNLYSVFVMWPLLLHPQHRPGGLLPPLWLVPLVLLALRVPPPLLLPKPLLLLPPRPRPWSLSLEKSACSGGQDDRCDPFFWGRVKYRVRVRMISAQSHFFIDCSVALTWSYSSGSARTKRACRKVSGVPSPSQPFGYSCLSSACSASLGLLLRGMVESWNFS